MKTLGYNIKFFQINPAKKNYEELKEAVNTAYDLDVEKGTVCVITEQESESLVSIGVAKLWFKDQFTKAKGRTASLTYAIQRFPREERRVIWEDIKKHCTLPRR